MRNIAASVLITVLLLVAGCQSAEKIVFVESSKINSKGLEGNSFTKPYMSAYKDLYVVRGLEKSGQGYKSSYRCLDLNKGTFSWWLQVGFTWNSDEQPIDDIKSFEDKLYINQGNTLVNFNLENDGPVWQSREKIDFILSAEKDKVFCLSEKMLDMKDGEYRNILCYDTTSHKLLWSVKAMSVESWNVRIGKEEVAYYSSKEEPITLHFILRESGLSFRTIDNVTRVFYNDDEPSNVLYLKGAGLYIHTPKKETLITGIDGLSPEKSILVVENNLVCESTDRNLCSCYDLNGNLLWSRKQSVIFMLAREKNLICFYSFLTKNHYSIDALNPKTGATMWTDQINLDSMPSLTVVDDYAVYPVTYDKIIVRSIGAGEVVQSIKDVNGFNSVWGIPGFGFMVDGKDDYLHFYKSVSDLSDSH